MKLSNALLAGCIALLPAMAAPKTGAPNTADTTFVHKAAQGGLAEVQLGQLAEQKGTNQAVKDFGQQMVTDHTKANDELKKVAASKNITVPDSIDAKDQALYDRLSKLSGATFDRQYIQSMIKDHEADVTEFRREAQSAKDTDIRNFASTTLPTLQHHLQMAKDANTKLSTSAGK